MYDIPDLPLNPTISGRFAFRRFFQGIGPKDTLAYALVMNYIRIADLAISEYLAGRNSILEFANSNESLRMGSAIRSSTHFEVCIDALKKAINLIKTIRGHPRVPVKLKDVFPSSAKLLLGETERKVSRMRHAIQHLDSLIQRGEITQGQSFALHTTKHCLELGEHKISYKELAEWLVEAHGLAQAVSNYREN